MIHNAKIKMYLNKSLVGKIVIISMPFYNENAKTNFIDILALNWIKI